MRPLRPLAAAVRADRTRRPGAYRRVADLEGLRPEFCGRSRLGRSSVAVKLRGMGPGALLPMLDALALSGYPRALSAEEGAALRLGLLETVGNLGDPRSLPLLRGVFATAVEAPELRAAARGLARVCQEADRRTLMGATGARRDPAAAALGLCANPAAGQWLVAQLEATTDPTHAAALARGLAEGASSWARPGTLSAVDATLRARAARTLVRRWRELPSQRDALGVAALSMGGAEVLTAVRDARRDAAAEAGPGLAALERALVRDHRSLEGLQMVLPRLSQRAASATRKVDRRVAAPRKGDLTPWSDADLPRKTGKYHLETLLASRPCRRSVRGARGSGP